MAQSQALVAECPTCQAVVPIDATECPQCGEQFEQEAGSTRSAGRAIPVSDETAEDEGTEEKSGSGEKFLFYTGILLILLGGPGIALGSWLHDVFRIPIIGEAYPTFGPVNRLATAIGLIVLIVGIVFLILSLRMAHPSDVEKDLSALRES